MPEVRLPASLDAIPSRGVPPVSVVVRARDEARALGRTLDALGGQDVPSEVIVVDSGSRDHTVEIAAQRGAGVLHSEAAPFSFGAALNQGAAAARAPVVVALSAHAVAPDRGWLGRVLATMADPAVACCCGERRGPDGRLLAGALRQDAALLAARPYWGYSNGAGAFRAELWRRRGFREDLPGSEDREWSRWALAGGMLCVVDPALVVDHDHSRDPLPACFRRYAREHRGFAMYLPDLEPYPAPAALAEWWHDQGHHRTRARARLDPRRVARLTGKWWGRRTVPAPRATTPDPPPPSRPSPPPPGA